MKKLAIYGGQPVRTQLLPYGHQSIDDEDIKAVIEILRTDWLTQGPKIDEFERTIANYCGARYAVAMSSGTAALHAACAAAGISSGDEVITTPMTFAASANAVVYCGGTPVFADILESTFNINPEEIKSKITSRTRAVLPVDFAGHPVDFDEIKQIARENQLIIIEDACHALGAEYKGEKVGHLSDMTVFSFHPVKHITTGEGGMVVTDDLNLYEKLKIFRHHGILRNIPGHGGWYYEISEPGYNFRITDFQCALGISQFKKLDYFISRRKLIAESYNKGFANLPELILPEEGESVKHAYHIYVIQLKLDMLKAGRREIFDALRAENIGVNVHYIPLHFQPFYRDMFHYKEGDFPKTEMYYTRAITLPVFPAMSDIDIEDVITAVKKVIEYYRN